MPLTYTMKMIFYRQRWQEEYKEYKEYKAKYDKYV